MNASVYTVTLNPALDKTIILPSLNVGELNRVKEIRIDPGGKGVNVAKVLKNFNTDVVATGFIAGEQGQQLRKQLNNLGINEKFLDVSGETRINLKIFDESSSITTEINELGFEVCEDDINNFLQLLSNEINKDTILVLGGSLPIGTPINSYKSIIEMGKEKEAIVILDADGQAFEEGIKAKPFAVKPNIFELEQYFGRSINSDKEILQTGQELLDLGISLVIVSMGSQGSLVMNNQEAYRVYPFSISPKSTVGAGDSMVAALVYCLINNMSLSEIALWMTTAGTITASKQGTKVCTLAEVKNSLNKTKILKLK